jgi:hypothetical protein
LEAVLEDKEKVESDHESRMKIMSAELATVKSEAEASLAKATEEVKVNLFFDP